MSRRRQEPQTPFSLAYGGPALEDGRMAVRDLAPSLLALGDLFNEANEIAFPDAPPVTLEIRAFQEGSFEVILHLTQSDVVTFFSDRMALAAATLVTLVMGAKGGVLAVIRLLHRRKITKREEIAPGMTRLTLDDGTVLETPSSVVLIVQRESVRRYAREVLKPLKQEGIDTFKVVLPQPDEPPLLVRATDMDAFEEGLADTALLDQNVEMVVSITTVSFPKANKWRLSDGIRTFWAGIGDEQFLARVDKGQESFMKGDILRCRVRMQQWQTETGLRTEFTVTRVLEHIHGAREMRLPMEIARPEEPRSPEDPKHDPPALPPSPGSEDTE
jgi:hypothetical protein